MSDPGVNDQLAFNGGQPHAEQPVVSPGAHLAAYREERGWTIEQVASQLNLAPRQVVALENDDYPALPGMPIVRGFMRAYAKLLRVDAAPLLTTLGGEKVFVNESIAPRETLSTPFSETRLPSMMERPALSSKWILGLLLFLLLGVAIWAAQQGGDLAVMSKPVLTQEKDGPANAAGPDASGQEAATAASAGAIMATAPATDAMSNATTEPGIVQAVPSAAPAGDAQFVTPPSEAMLAEKPVRIGTNTLLLEVHEDSWIEIKRAGSDSAALSRIVHAGETEAYEVTEPISLIVGNAGGVKVSLRGTPVELKTSTSSNVARLNLK